jgi:Ca2+-binding RTX toxin-like protein
MTTLRGTDDDEDFDIWRGVTDNADYIYGFGGRDRIWGLGGNDWLQGGAGPDELFGDTHTYDPDTEQGGDTAAYVDSNVGVYVNLVTGTGRGGTAEGDTLNGIENLSGSGYGDLLVGNDVENWLWGMAGNDTLDGNGGRDHLSGWTGNDTLVGGEGADVLDGGWGIDTASYLDSGVGVVVSLQTGLGGGGTAAGDGLFGIENLTGSFHDDALTGDDGANTLRGSWGNDVLWAGDGADDLYGEAGNDTLTGASGVDRMYGGRDNDMYYVDNALDEVHEAGGEGLDVVRTSTNYVLTEAADVETLETIYYAGTTGFSLTGNSTGNLVRGNHGANTLNGGGGNDELIGLAGNDSFLFDTPLNAATNVDVLSDFNVADDRIVLDDAIFALFATGGLAAERFVVGPAAVDASDNIIYNPVTGAISYDVDANGAAVAVQFARVTPGLPLSHLDFVIV